VNFAFDRLGMRIPMIWISSFIAPGTTINQKLQHTSFMRFIRSLFSLPDVPLTNRDRDAPNVNLSQIFGTVKSAWPEVTARPYTPSGFSDDKIDEMSFFVSLAEATFKSYLAELDCAVDTFLNQACTPGGDGSFTTLVKIIIIVVVLGSCFICSCIFLGCYRNGEYMKKSVNGCCCRPGGFGSTGEQPKPSKSTQMTSEPVALAPIN